MTIQNPIITPADRTRLTEPAAEAEHDAIVEAAGQDDDDEDDDDQQTHETPYLTNQTSTHATERWQRVQATFVDDPRKSVAEAHELVGDLVQRIVDAFAQERNELERQWSKGDSVSTEDLRVCLQRYRAFFSRLLPSVNGAGRNAS